MPHEWKMPLCKVKNRLHGDKQLYRLIEPDFDLSRIRADLIRRKKLRGGRKLFRKMPDIVSLTRKPSAALEPTSQSDAF